MLRAAGEFKTVGATLQINGEGTLVLLTVLVGVDQGHRERHRISGGHYDGEGIARYPLLRPSRSKDGKSGTGKKQGKNHGEATEGGALIHRVYNPPESHPALMLPIFLYNTQLLFPQLAKIVTNVIFIR